MNRGPITIAVIFKTKINVLLQSRLWQRESIILSYDLENNHLVRNMNTTKCLEMLQYTLLYTITL